MKTWIIVYKVDEDTALSTTIIGSDIFTALGVFIAQQFSPIDSIISIMQGWSR